MNKDILYLAGLTENFDSTVEPGKHPEMCGWYLGMIKTAHGKLQRSVQLAERYLGDPEEQDDPAAILNFLMKEVKEVVQKLEESQFRAKEYGYIR